MSSAYPLKGKTADEVPRNSTKENLNSVCRDMYLQLPRKKDMNHSEDSDQVKEREMVYKQRNERVREVCERYKDVRKGLKPYEGEFFIYDMKNRLAWCRTAKCGTSTWFKHFATLSGLDDRCLKHLSTGDYRLRVRTLLRLEEPKMSKMSRFHVDEFTKRNGLFTFTFVRHPFERIISAYENKVFVREKGRRTKRAHGAEKLRKYLLDRYDKISFPNFAKMILDMAEERKCSVATSCNMDPHIRPFSHYCSFCEVSYDVIGTMEDFDDDVEFIARKMDISELLDHKGNRVNQTPDSRKFGNNQTERITAHFSLLERDVRLKLYDLYKMDFEMFGYDAAQYL